MTLHAFDQEANNPGVFVQPSGLAEHTILPLPFFLLCT